MSRDTHEQKEDWKLTDLEKTVASLIAEQQQEDENWRYSKNGEGVMVQTVRHKKMYARIIRTCADNDPVLDKLMKGLATMIAKKTDRINELQSRVDRQNNAGLLMLAEQATTIKELEGQVKALGSPLDALDGQAALDERDQQIQRQNALMEEGAQVLDERLAKIKDMERQLAAAHDRVGELEAQLEPLHEYGADKKLTFQQVHTAVTAGLAITLLPDPYCGKCERAVGPEGVVSGGTCSQCGEPLEYPEGGDA